jgi:hypothetical protein
LAKKAVNTFDPPRPGNIATAHRLQHYRRVLLLIPAFN